MTMTKFVLREPGNHHEIARGKMSYVPRQGELVTMDDISHTVHQVNFDLSTNSVTVYLNP